MDRIYELEGPDGEIYEIEGPENARESDLIDALQGYLAETAAASVAQSRIDEDKAFEDQLATDLRLAEAAKRKRLLDEEGFFSTAKKGIVEGYLGTGLTAAEGAASLLPEDAERKMEQIIDEAREATRYDTARRDDIEYLIGSGLGSIGAFFTPAVLALFAPVSATAATLIGGTALGMAAGAGEASQRVREARKAGFDVSNEQEGLAELKGMGIGVLEALPFARILKIPGLNKFAEAISGDINADTFLRNIGQRIRSAGATGGMEAAQEMTAGILQNAVEQGYNPTKALTDAGLIDEGIAGGGSGAIVQAVADLFIKGRTRSADVTEDTRQEPTLDTPPTTPVTETPTPAPLTEDAEKAQQTTLEAINRLNAKGVAAPTIEQITQEVAATPTVETPATPEQVAGEPSFVDLVTDILSPSAQASTISPQREEDALEAIQRLTAAETREGDTDVRPTGRDDGDRGGDPLRTRPTEERPRVSTEDDILGVERTTPATEVPETPEAPQDLRLDRLEPPPERIDGRERIDTTPLNVDKDLAQALGVPQPETPVAAAKQPEAVEQQREPQVPITTPTTPKDVTQERPTAEQIQERKESGDPIAGSPEAIRQDRQADADINRLRQTKNVDGYKAALEEEFQVAKREMPADKDQTQLQFWQNKWNKAKTIEQVDKVFTEMDAIRFPADQREDTAPKTPEQISLEKQIAETVKATPAPKLRKIKETTAKTPYREEIKQPDVKEAAKKLKEKQKRAEKRTSKQKLRSEVQALSGIKEGVKKAKRLKEGREQLEASVATKEVRDDTGKLEFYTAPFADKSKQKASYVDQKTGEEQTVNFDKALSADDNFKILRLITTKLKEKRSKQAKGSAKGTEADERARAAKIYFSRQQDPADALDAMAQEAVFADPTFRAEPNMSKGEREYFDQKGGKTARNAIRWVLTNLSPEVKAQLRGLIEVNRSLLRGQQRIDKSEAGAIDVERSRDQQVREQKIFAADQAQTEKETAEDEAALSKADRDALRALRAENPDIDFNVTEQAIEDFLPDALRVDSVELDTPLHPQVKNLLAQGKLLEALRALSVTTSSKDVRQLASKLARYVGTTKLEVTDILLDDQGFMSAGQFDPKTNTITLDSEAGLNTHTLLHEMAHAATSATLANKSHPVTKQLTKLFNEVKDSLDSYYGGQNVDEFVAEAFANAKFQSKLAGINPNGSPITALQRFINTVTNLLRNIIGLDSKSIESAKDNFDKISDALLAPSPDTRDAGALSMASGPNGVRQILNEMRDAQQNINSKPSVTRQRHADNIAKFLYEGNKMVNRFLLSTLGTKSIGDVASRVSERLGKVARMAHETIERQRGAIQASDKEVRDFTERFANWSTNNPNKKAAMDRLIYSTQYGATIFQVDPNKPESHYTTKKDGKPKFDSSGNNLQQIWKSQRKDWRDMGPDGHKYFNEMRKLYEGQYEKLRKAIYGEIDRLVPDSKSNKRLKKNVYQQLFQKSKLEVYFPLVRKGKYILEITDSQPADPSEARVVVAFDSPSARERAKQLAEEKEGVTTLNIDSGDRLGKSFKDAPPASFVGETLQVLDANNVSAEAREAFMRLFLDALPESSFAKSLQKRKNVTGYIEDSLIGVKTKAFDIGRQAVKLEYAAKYRELESMLSDIEKLPRQQGRGGTTLAGKAKDRFVNELEMINEIQKRLYFANYGASFPFLERLAVGANQFAFNYTIGFNISSAVVNSSQIPLFALPYMAVKHGWSASTAALKQGASLANTLLPGVGGVEQVNDFYNIDKNGNYTLKEGLNLTPEMRERLQYFIPAVKEAAERGYLGRSYLLDVLGVNEGGREANLPDKITQVSAMGFNFVEKYNRQTVLFSNYKLNRDAMDSEARIYSETQGKFFNTKDLTDAQKDTLAAQEALYQAEQLNGGLAIETAPRITQQNIGRVALMYKTYGANMYYTMLKSLARVLDSDIDPQLRSQAFKQLIAVHGSAALFSGIHGVPIYGVVKSIFGLFDFLFGEDDDEDFDTIVRNYIGEGFYKGGLNQLLAAVGVPVDVATRTKLSGLIFQENRFAQNESTEEFLFRVLFGPAGSTYKRFERAAEDLSEGEFERGIENLLPPAVANALKSTFGRYARDGEILTRRGDPIVDDITAGELLGQLFGFAPTRYTFEQERNQVLKNIDRKIVTQRTKLLRRLYIAIRRGDHSGRLKAIEEIGKFNRKFSRKNPDAVIDMNMVIRSIKQHRKSSAKMHNGVTISPTNRRYIQELSDRWG